MLKKCSSSEVAAMMEGLIRHSADVDSNITANYTDTHRASVVGFAFTHLLGYRLLPRLKNIGASRLYRPGDSISYPSLEPVLTRAVKWELITQQYDQMIKYARALQLGTAEAEQILRRFQAPGCKHPTLMAIESWAARCAPCSSPRSWLTPTCAARSTRGSRSSNSGTTRTSPSTTAEGRATRLRPRGRGDLAACLGFDDGERAYSGRLTAGARHSRPSSEPSQMRPRLPRCVATPRRLFTLAANLPSALRRPPTPGRFRLGPYRAALPRRHRAPA